MTSHSFLLAGVIPLTGRLQEGEGACLARAGRPPGLRDDESVHLDRGYYRFVSRSPSTESPRKTPRGGEQFSAWTTPGDVLLDQRHYT